MCNKKRRTSNLTSSKYINKSKLLFATYFNSVNNYCYPSQVRPACASGARGGGGYKQCDSCPSLLPGDLSLSLSLSLSLYSSIPSLTTRSGWFPPCWMLTRTACTSMSTCPGTGPRPAPCPSWSGSPGELLYSVRQKLDHPLQLLYHLYLCIEMTT